MGKPLPLPTTSLSLPLQSSLRPRVVKSGVAWCDAPVSGNQDWGSIVVDEGRMEAECAVGAAWLYLWKQVIAVWFRPWQIWHASLLSDWWLKNLFGPRPGLRLEFPRPRLRLKLAWVRGSWGCFWTTLAVGFGSAGGWIATVSDEEAWMNSWESKRLCNSGKETGSGRAASVVTRSRYSDRSPLKTKILKSALLSGLPTAARASAIALTFYK